MEHAARLMLIENLGLSVLAFNETADVQAFVETNKVEFPVGLGKRDRVMEYLGLSPMSRFVVPQIMVVSRNGQVRAQSEPLGSPELQDKIQLRELLAGLLNEAKPAK